MLIQLTLSNRLNISIALHLPTLYKIKNYSFFVLTPLHHIKTKAIKFQRRNL
jgi:hypothetical protein